VFTILSNLRLLERWERSGVSGTSLYASSCGEILRQLRNSDLVIINGLEMTLKLCELFAVAPWLRRPLVAVDVVLRKPESVKSWLSAAMTRQLLRKVEYFLHYFRDLSGYKEYFDVGPERSGYVPFKPNLRYRVEARPNAKGEYVLCLGYSMRDYETFFKAVGKLGYPAAIAAPNFAELRRHYSRFPRSLSEVPANVRLLPDDGSQESLVRILSGAKLVVLPILKSSLCASGIGICLNSMMLGKCVLISRGPGGSDVLTDEALFFEPDADDLAAAMQRAYENDELRKDTAARGHAYALSLGGEPELYERVLTAAAHWYTHRRCSRGVAMAGDIPLNSSSYSQGARALAGENGRLAPVSSSGVHSCH
jgi:glycosyltransferase involved in cell wall biosynthesis